MLKIIFYLLTATLILAFGSTCLAQVDWEQQLDGWVDDVYYPYLFLGGSVYTRISFADIDNDGDLDLFYGGGDCGSLVYFENVGDVNNPIFELRYEEFPRLMNIYVNRYGGTVDVDFADLDNDGDLDAAYSRDLDAGGMIYWNDGSPEEADFVYRSPLGPLSGNSSVTLVDIDNDDDYDYFSGHGDYPHQLIFARNYGTPDSAYFHHQGDTHNYQNLFFSRPFNFDMGDIDDDGDVDLIICKPHGPVAFYENTGTPDSAYFTHITDDFLPGRDTTDWTESPELADIDGDGDLDLFLAGGYAHLFYFENTGTPDSFCYVQRYDTTFFFVQPYTAGSWLKNSVDIDGDGDDDLALGRDLFLNESTGHIIRFTKHESLVPFVAGCFADMDADGDYDFLAPAGSYSIIYFENQGDRFWPEWEDGNSLFPPDGRIETPFTVGAGDLDNDGDNDILIGHLNNWTISYYRNDGTPELGQYTYAGNFGLYQFDHGYYYNLLLEDIDDDSDLDLLIGDVRTNNNSQLNFFYYRNDGTPEVPAWTYITDDFLNYISEHRNGTVVPCLADLDKDGDKDLAISNNLGLQLYLNPLIQTEVKNIIIEKPDETSIINAFPNPSNAVFSLMVFLEHSADINFEIYDLLGKRVTEIHSGFAVAGEYTFIWNSSSFASGVYFASLQTERNNYYIKLVVLK